MCVCLAGGRTLVAANEDVSSSHFVVHDRGILTTRVCCCCAAVQSPGGRMGREGRGVVRVSYRRDWEIELDPSWIVGFNSFDNEPGASRA